MVPHHDSFEVLTLEFVVKAVWALPGWLLALAGLAIVLVLIVSSIQNAARDQRFRERLHAGTLLPEDVSATADFLYAEYCRGRLYPEVHEQLLRLAGVSVSVFVANKLVCVEVAAGRYAEALQWRARCQMPVPETDWELVFRINEAEALANLGKVDEALSWVTREGSSWIARAGLAAHRAWCFSMLGRIPEARASLARARWWQLPPGYMCEWFLASAAVAMGDSAWTDAEAALVRAKKLALRASSKRNVQFSLALLLQHQGRLEESVAAFSEGAQMFYVGQGGDALLAWGDALSTLGRTDEARSAWTMCAERDPQSPAASTARQRLEAPSPPRGYVTDASSSEVPPGKPQY